MYPNCFSQFIRVWSIRCRGDVLCSQLLAILITLFFVGQLEANLFFLRAHLRLFCLIRISCDGIFYFLFCGACLMPLNLDLVYKLSLEEVFGLFSLHSIPIPITHRPIQLFLSLKITVAHPHCHFSLSNCASRHWDQNIAVLLRQKNPFQPCYQY